MPGKHDLSDAEDDPSTPQQSSSKRSRRKSNRSIDQDQGSPLPGSSPPPNAEDDDDDEEEEEEDPMSDIEPQDQEAIDRMRATQAIKSNNHKIAEAGVITHVKLENFMCHYSTEVDFGPQVNFLVGVNGSGKSAVLTGITMALGGNAKATNRGTKGGDLIREGQPSARVAVTLANRGEDAFKPDVYGDEMTVERTLNKAGGGNYKIKNSDGKTVDTKKATLDAILDHFNLQVDNPMTVLTQDQSRQFLSKASPRDKYNFFLRGTQLAQLTEEYEQIRANTETMEEALTRKREVIPELKDAYKRAKDRYKEAQAALEQKNNLDKLKNQLAWSYVEEMEERIHFAKRKINDEEARGEKIEAEVERLKEASEVNAGEVTTAKEAEAESRTASETHKPELEALKNKIKQNKLRIQKWKDTERQMGSDLRRHQELASDLDRRIAEEEAKLSRDIEAERAPLRLAIEKATDDITKIDIQVTRMNEELDKATDEYRTQSDEYNEIKSSIRNAENAKQQAIGRMNNIRAAARDKLMKYGNGMPQLVQAIKGERGWRGRVIGPMGLHVKLNHGEYAKTLDSFFNHYLNGFVCEDHEDTRRLRAMMKRFNLPNETMVLCVQYDEKFEADLAQGEPDPQILTVLRALTIDDRLVRQALINANQIEKIALVPRRPDGDNLMRTDPRNVSRAFSGDMYQLRHSGGRSSSTSMGEWRGAPRLQADASHSIAAIEDDIRRINNDIQEFERRRAEVARLAQAAEQKRKNLDNDIRGHQSRKRQLEREIARNTEKLTEEQPNNISALLSSKEEVDAQIANVQAQYQAGLANKESQDQDLKPDVERSNWLQNEINKAENLASKINVHLASIYAKGSKIDQDLRRANAAKETWSATLESYRNENARYEEILAERTEQASSICDRPEYQGKRKNADRLKKEIDSIEKALRERAKQQGATLEQIAEEMDVRKRAAQVAVQSTNELALLINQLERAYDNRTSKWTDFRSHICHRAKMQFGYYLSNRGFHGKLKFDHEHTQLHLAVQTDADKGQEKSKRKEANSLSGGEKSFSTICLLLTMWEAVGCPLRCLDEFDVFMDAVNRRIAMNMMIDTAKAADQTQFVLITPQDMGSIAWGKEVKVVKMGDPKRTQGALAAGR